MAQKNTRNGEMKHWSSVLGNLLPCLVLHAERIFCLYLPFGLLWMGSMIRLLTSFLMVQPRPLFKFIFVFLYNNYINNSLIWMSAGFKLWCLVGVEANWPLDYSSQSSLPSFFQLLRIPKVVKNTLWGSDADVLRFQSQCQGPRQRHRQRRQRRQRRDVREKILQRYTLKKNRSVTRC